VARRRTSRAPGRTPRRAGPLSIRALAQQIGEPLLEVNDIQGNILAGFSKDHQSLIALAIRDVGAARRWLARIEGHVSSTAEVLQFNQLFRMQRARMGADPPGLVATWANVAFSHDGLARLTSRAHADAVPDVPFRAGLPTRAALLGDRAASPSGDPTSEWVVGKTGHVPDVLLIVAGDDPRRLADICRRLRPNAGDGRGAPEVIWQELGETRIDLPGHEHFGFKDGVSQPAVRGIVSSGPDVFLSPRSLVPPAPGEVECAKPGQPLIWPGQFVFGYASMDRSGASGGGPVAPPPDLPGWIRNGSLLVFRRLRQDVAGFTNFIDTAARDPSLSVIPGMSPELLGALCVGRWKSGAPISRAPNADLPALAGDALANNDFLFTVDTPAPVLLPGTRPPSSAFPPARADMHGLVCPHAAHVRKMNPRDQDSDLGDQFDTLTRRILRRGISYGPPLPDPRTDDGVDRGLHFLSYQTSIESQFEMLQQNWANRRDNPTPGGHDIIIGQTADQALTIELLISGGAASVAVSTPTQFVRATGGGYFFAPSIETLRHVLAGGNLP
jgi:Dyp-type peroxidase family